MSRISSAGPLGLALWLPLILLPAQHPQAAGGQGPPLQEWTLEGGGRRAPGGALEVAGTGGDCSFWRSGELPLAPGGLYRFRMHAWRPAGQGTAISGPDFANMDHPDVGPEPRWFGHPFRVPENRASGVLRLGQWHATGTLRFDAIQLHPCLAVHLEERGLLLGEGESIRQGTYSFVGRFGPENGNYHRVLAEATARFNSSRWTFAGGDHATYRFTVPGARFTWAGFGWNVCHHAGGACLAEVSADGGPWRAVAARGGVGTEIAAALPDGLLPARELRLRFRAEANAAFQVDGFEFQGRLDPPPADSVGTTLFADLLAELPGLRVEAPVLERTRAREELRLALTNERNQPAPILIELAADGSDPSDRIRGLVGAGEESILRIPMPLLAPGRRTLRLRIRDEGASQAGALLALERNVSELYRSDYGRRISGTSGEPVLWWCAAGWKVARRRPAPTVPAPVLLTAARNDLEAVQVVLAPVMPLAGLRAAASALLGPQGAVIPSDRIEIALVHYHFVHQPTDSAGARDLWPDALPPLEQPIDLEPGRNHPLWVRVRVPADAAPGRYEGALALSAEGWSARVPLALEVWDFTLPKRGRLESALGLCTETLFRYHGLRSTEQKRKILDLYFQTYADNRISPYDPAPLDPIRASFHPRADPPRAELDCAAFDAAMDRAQERFGFSNFRLPVLGLGGGSFHARTEPSLAGFPAGDPIYEALFADYAGRLEAHLRAKGLLQKAYVYWFDEPAPKDYPFVAEGMQRLRRCAPGLPRMLTEEPNPALTAAVDIWCPVSMRYDHAEARRRRAEGARFWWYLCTEPKAPYCTLFIDHPATKPRVWLWQTWQRQISGILVWQTNYWTSAAAFPDSAQDPYLDPMAYVSGYSTPAGVKRHWGNGDGRLLYPPLAARTPPPSGAPPVIARPVPSIRLEMLREGIEDFEMLALLRERLESAVLPEGERARLGSLLEVPGSITAGMTAFTTDPGPIHARRAEIARAIERLGR